MNRSKFTRGVSVKTTSGMTPRRAFLGSTWSYDMLGTWGRKQIAKKLRCCKMVDYRKYFCYSFFPFWAAASTSRHHTNPIPPSPERDAWYLIFQKEKKKEIFETLDNQLTKPVNGATICAKIRGKTLKLFALQASPYKGCKPRVNLDEFIFSTSAS